MGEGDFRGKLFIADADSAVREVLGLAFSFEGFHVRRFADGRSLVDAARLHVPACILLGMSIAAPSAFDILAELRVKQSPAPVFVMSSECTIPMAVQAIKSGAFDLIEKPFNPADVVARILDAVESLARSADVAKATSILPPQFPGCNLLTQRETEILAQIALGHSNKEAGRQFGVSPRTIEVHRARVMEKLGARNAADLVRIVFSRPGPRAVGFPTPDRVPIWNGVARSNAKPAF